jgi:hypothetical protein
MTMLYGEAAHRYLRGIVSAQIASTDYGTVGDTRASRDMEDANRLLEVLRY